MDQGRTTSLRLGQGKLIPRDISESLGKLPPQALDLEEAVLGALMLESRVVDSTLAYLKPEHFYTDAHREIFQAIVDLRKANEPVDMRLVINQLRKTGKIELVGGTYVIPELTAKVSSAANIEFHARVVMEMAIKRRMIELASRIHDQAYGEGDVFVMLEKNIEELKFLEERHTTSSGPEKIKKLWETTLLTTKPPEQEVFIRIDGHSVASEGNHSLLVGKKKSRKTLFLTWEVHQFLLRPYAQAEEVLMFDTEQGQSHVWKVRERVRKLTGKEVPIFYMRGMSPSDRKDFIRMTVLYWEEHKKVKPKLIIIDGIRDLMSNINDADESTELIVWLEKITLEHGVHIINVLHLNKTSSDPRGHIGSELLNKAEVTIELELDPKTGVTMVKCESSREEPFNHFSFTHGPDGLPLMVDNPVGGQLVNQDDKLRRLQFVFQDGDLRYKEYLKQIQENFQVGANKAGFLMKEFQQKGWVMKIGRDKSPDALYKLMVTVGVSTPVTPPKEVVVDPDKGHPFDDQTELSF